MILFYILVVVLVVEAVVLAIELWIGRELLSLAVARLVDGADWNQDLELRLVELQARFKNEQAQEQKKTVVAAAAARGGM